MGERPWRIDAGVAWDLGAALDWSGGDGAAALAVRLPERVPCGSTAKLAAVAREEVPPGADPDDLARRILDHLHACATGPAGGAPTPSWSCWVLATVMAALVDHADLGPVRVAATRRTDPAAPVVDLHAAVLVDEGGPTTWADPYFGVALALPDQPGAPATGRQGAVEVTAEREPGGRWVASIRQVGWRRGLAYRVVAPELDRDDVRAVCAISVEHTGVPARPFARLHPDGGCLEAWRDEGGAGVVRCWPGRRPDGRPAGSTTDVHRTWAEAVDRVAERTGTRIT